MRSFSPSPISISGMPENAGEGLRIAYRLGHNPLTDVKILSNRHRKPESRMHHQFHVFWTI